MPAPRSSFSSRRPLLALALAAAASLCPWGAGAHAQAVERPEPFDSAGRVAAITPSVAARLQLGPPAWRITGNYQEARLYSLGDGGYVIIVTRPSGAVERYSVTAYENDGA
jgi:hypothetical protein